MSRCPPPPYPYDQCCPRFPLALGRRVSTPPLPRFPSRHDVARVMRASSETPGAPEHLTTLTAGGRGGDTSPASAKRAQQHSHCASSMLLLSMSSGLTFYSMYGTPGDSVSPYDCWYPRLLVFSDTLPPRSGNITVCITIHTLVRTLAHIRLPRKPVRSTASSTMATGHDSMM